MTSQLERLVAYDIIWLPSERARARHARRVALETHALETKRSDPKAVALRVRRSSQGQASVTAAALVRVPSARDLAHVAPARRQARRKGRGNWPHTPGRAARRCLTLLAPLDATRLCHAAPQLRSPAARACACMCRDSHHTPLQRLRCSLRPRAPLSPSPPPDRGDPRGPPRQAKIAIEAFKRGDSFRRSCRRSRRLSAAGPASAEKQLSFRNVARLVQDGGLRRTGANASVLRWQKLRASVRLRAIVRRAFRGNARGSCSERRLPRCDVAFHTILRTLQPRVAVRLFASLLCQQNVVLVSTNVGLLADVAEAALALLWPVRDVRGCASTPACQHAVCQSPLCAAVRPSLASFRPSR